MHNHNWLSFLPGIEAGYAPWLRDHGSLTQRIRQRCAEFNVRNVCDRLMAAAHDETALLGLPPRQLIYTREVFLIADNRPVVFAHSVVSPQHLRGAWQALQRLGKRPLAALLFAHPLVQRAPLHYRTLKAGHPLYRRAVAALDTPPNGHGKHTVSDDETRHARYPDGTTSHSTRLPKDGNQVAGYLPSPLDGTTSHSTRLPKTAAKSPVIPQTGEGDKVSLRELPNKLLARRSLFSLHGAPLLVTEVFLPDILRLRE